MLSIFKRPEKPQNEPVAAEVPSAGTVTVPVEVAALAAYVVTAQYLDPATLSRLLVELGLAVRVPFDPEVHGDFDELLPGDTFSAFSAAFCEVLNVGRPKLRIFTGKLN